MAFTPRAWFDKYVPKASDLIDMETRLAAYTDLIGGGGGGSGFTVFLASGGDDTSALAAVISAAASTGATILCPSALYKISSITLPSTSGKTITIIGAGIGATKFLQYNNPSIGTSVVTMFNIPAGRTFRLRDCTVDGTCTMSGAGDITIGNYGIMRLILQNAGSGGLFDAERVRFTKYSYAVWTEDQFTNLRDCIFDGGDGGNGMGGTYTNGINNGYAAADGRVFMENCLFTDNGVVPGGGMHHSTYFYSGVAVTAINCRYERLWGVGYHCHHNDDRILALRAIGVESNYINCYIGGGITSNLVNGFAIDPESVMTLTGCTVETVDIPFYIEKNAKLNLFGCIIKGTAGTAVFNYEDTGIEIFADDCTFDTDASYHFYLFNTGGKLTVKNSRFTGTVSADVIVPASMTGTTVILDGNIHTGATVNAAIFTSGTRATIKDNHFYGTYSNAVIRNNTSSTLGILNILDNDFSQGGGASNTNTVAPTTLYKLGNYGSVGLT